MSHPLPQDLLLSYAQGDTDEAMSLLVAAHASMCAQSAERLCWIEERLGEGLSATPPAALPADMLQGLLSQLDTPAPRETAPIRPDLGLDIPEPLWPYLVGKQWSAVVPGRVHQVRLDLTLCGTPVALVRMRPGFVSPTHGHLGAEYNLVLQGGLLDMGDEFLPGDVAVRGAQDEHSPGVCPELGCTVLLVQESPAQMRSWLSRLVARWTLE